MNTVSDTLLSLLRIGIGKKVPELRLSQELIPELMSLAKNQDVSAIVADGISKLCSSSGLKLEQDRFFQLYDVIFKQEKQYQSHFADITKFNAFLSERSVESMVLKGYGLSLNYPVRQHRKVGDLDIWNFGKGEEADRLIEQELCIKLDRSYLKHTVFNYRGTFVENHHDFLDTIGHHSNRWLEKLLEDEACPQNCLSISTYLEGKEYLLRLPSVRFNSIYILRHSACHFAAEGIRLRHLLDWGFFVEKYHHDIDWAELEDIAKKSNMIEFLKCQNAVCIDYLGFEESKFGGLVCRGALEERLLGDVLCKEFKYRKTGNPVKDIPMRFNRWKSNLWKFRMVYDELPLIAFFMQSFAHLTKPASLK